MLPFLLYWLSCVGTLFSGASTEIIYPSSNWTVNSTLVERGHPFIGTCQLVNYTVPSSDYKIFIYRNRMEVFGYHFPAASSGGSRKPSIENMSDSGLTVRSLAYNLTMAQVEFTPLEAGHFYLMCGGSSFNSYSINIKVVKRLPTVTFTLNTTSPQLNRPFTATCVIGNFNLTAGANTTVSFYSTRDGRLATYESVEGTSLLFIHKHGHLAVHAGTRSSFPRFDLLLVESSDVQQCEYWCQLEEPSIGAVTSKHWLQEPVVSFTSSAPNATTRLGTCLVGNFSPAGREYSVQFWTDRGPKSVNRLASYTVKPNHILEFEAEEVPSWAELLTGKGVSLPAFTLLAKGSVSFQSGAWWCVLGVGVQGSATYREIVSSAVNLA